MDPIDGICDLHSHVLPGVDDGAEDIATALQLVEQAVEQGITTMVATPHTLDGVYDVSRSAAAAAGDALAAAIRAAGHSLDVRVAAEVHLHESIPDRVAADPSLTLDGSGRYLLLELPHQAVPPSLPQLLFGLRTRGTTPIIAHPERNLAVRGDIEVTRAWLEHGAQLQLTYGSLDGTFGGVIEKCARRLLELGRVAVLATDTHHPRRRPPKTREALRVASAIVGEAGARRLAVDNPRAVLAGQSIGPVQRARRSRLGWWRRREVAR